MAIQRRLPNADDFVQWSRSAGADNYLLVDDPVGSHDSDSTYTYAPVNGTVADTFEFAVFTIPAGATINSVTLKGYFRYEVNGITHLHLRMTIGGTIYPSAEKNPQATYGLESWERTTNPKTTIAWTVDDVNGVGANALQFFGYYNDTLADIVTRCTQIYLEVDYTPLPVTHLLTGTIDITTTSAGILSVSKKLTGAIAIASTVAGHLTKFVSMTGSIAITSTTSGSLSVTKTFTGTIAIVTTVSGNLISSIPLVSTPIAIETTISGVMQVTHKLVGTIAIETTIGGVLKVSKKLVGTTVAIETTTSGILKLVRGISGTSTLRSAASGALSVTYLVGTTIEIQTNISGVLSVTKKLSGSIDIVTTVDGWLYEFVRLHGSIGITTTLAGDLSIYVGIKELTGSIAIATTIGGSLIVRSPEIPPFMDADLIDPFSGGAWLWLVEIAVPGETTQRIARNTADVRYDGTDFDKSNIQIGQQIFTGDGSIPRVTLKVMQDASRAIEGLINDTEGALGAAVKLIRVNERFLETPVSALEADYDNLAAESDSEWVTFTLGMPNPLTQRFPLDIYSSSMCPLATPSLFKGPKCQYAGGDGTCTGTYEDCFTKGNAVHFGAELGLNPNVVRI